MAVLFAFSLQDQVEKYGAYVGLAAFLGLAVLTVLYFAQARELKRLRDWAGRAPERAQEIEARVVAQADELRRQGTAEPAPSGNVGPAQPVVAASGNGRAAGKPAPIPIGPRPAVAVAAATARAQAAGAVATVEAPETTEAAEGDEAAETAVATASSPQDTQVFTPDGADDAPDTTGEPPPPDEPPADEAMADVPPAADEAAEPEPAAPSGNGQAAPAPGIPRATPRPQPAAPLRAPARSATVPPRRPAAPAAARREDSSRAARITAITLASIVALGAVVFAITQVVGGDSNEPKPAPNVAASPNGSASPQASTDVSDQRADTVVTVLNGTPTPGLAGATRDKLIKAGYSDATGLVRTGNNTDQQRQDSAVFYASGQRRMARDVAQILGITAKPEAIDPDTLALANNTGEGAAGHETDVVAIVGLDQSP
jgi:hypothetical protein